MTKKVIMLSGFKNAGKDTTAKLIADTVIGNNKPYNSCIYYAFALPIKQAASVIFDIPFDILDGKTADNRKLRETVNEFWSKIIPNFTPRKGLTMLGTDILREHIHDDIWILNAQKQILECNYDLFIITDLREPNEEIKIEQFCNDNNIEVLHINIVRELPSWYNVALKAYDGDQKSLDILTELEVHASEWKQVGLTPDIVILNNSDDFKHNIIKQIENIQI